MKRYITGYLTIAALLILSACKVSKDVQLPDTQLPNAYRTATVADTASIARLPWKSFFTETTLQNLIDSAITRNNDLQIAVKNIESAQLTLRQAR